MKTNKHAKIGEEKLRSVSPRLDALEKMTVGELQAEWVRVFKEPARSRNKDYLRKRIGYRLQEIAEGGLSDRAKLRIEELAKDAPIRRRQGRALAGVVKVESTGRAQNDAAASRDGRLPAVGSVIRKAHDGKEHVVTVRDDGFEYRGRIYRSLSAVAKQITGTVWNGWTFFGLKARSA